MSCTKNSYSTQYAAHLRIIPHDDHMQTSTATPTITRNLTQYTHTVSYNAPATMDSKNSNESVLPHMYICIQNRYNETNNELQ